MENQQDHEIGQGEIRVKFKMPQDPRRQAFDITQIFLTSEDAEKYIKDNSSWLPEASIVKVHEYVIATYIHGKKI